MCESVDQLLKKIHASSNPLRVAAYQALLEQLLMNESNEQLKLRIEESTDTIEIKAAKWVFWEKNLDKSFEGLMQILQSSSDNEKVREAAILLGDGGFAEAVVPLIELLHETESRNVRNGVALGLRALRDQRALQPIVEEIKRDPKNASTLFYALENLDCRKIVEFLVGLFLMQAHDFLARCSIIDCIRKTRPSNLSEELVTTCVRKLQESITSESNEEYVRHARELKSLLGAGGDST